MCDSSTGLCDSMLSATRVTYPIVYLCPFFKFCNPSTDLNDDRNLYVDVILSVSKVSKKSKVGRKKYDA